MADWREQQGKRRTKLSKAAVATMERVFELTQWPAAETIRSLYDLHRITRRQALEWFEERRREEKVKSRQQRDIDG